jgi:hypothetical protein
MREGGITDAGFDMFRTAADRLGLSGPDRVRVAAALRDSPAEPALSEDTMSARVDQWWGSQADAKLEAAERAWNRLTKAERLALTPRRGSRAFMEELARIGASL